MSAGRVAFLDTRFDTLTAPEVRNWIAARAPADGFAYVVTPNVDHMVRLAKAPPEVRRAYDEAGLLVCDSRVLARLAKFAGVELSVVPGSDLTALLFAEVIRAGDRICLIGGEPDHPAKLAQRYPGVEIVQHQPPHGLRTNAAARADCVDFAAANPARLILLAVGSPQQEMLAREMAESGRVTGTALCIGASVDFLVGAQQRAPEWVQKANLEWAWRLLGNPRRLAKRYLVDGPAIFPMVWRWRATQRRRAS
ncbi:WecB/TagA/CpsF family glycosyltransferase [Sphingomonas sp.]|uniref:WecB/TagA/CpsF family glycosyltransferase n=1 Tax=Sphingomonas sp. TaxID=28214 RepID=UPI001B29B1C5|nr:WecB/TagA/CpsF family glycosyltransferase [Sphingomonas sp.]MBO9714536.1 WecB/TagA/CpsF family glycosyltransferase [Sphingomonas sp.]